VFDDEIVDRGGNYNPSLSRFTAPVAGAYEFTIVFTDELVNNGPEVDLFVNGVVRYSSVAIGYGEAYQSTTATVIDILEAGDYVEWWVGNNNGATIRLAGGRCWFSGKFLG
jgi:hypothetical protein